MFGKNTRYEGTDAHNEKLDMVLKNPYSIKHIPTHLINEELCLVALKKNVLLKRFIPIELLTFDICKELIFDRFMNVLSIPKNENYRELLILGLEYHREDPSVHYALDYLFNSQSMNFLLENDKDNKIALIMVNNHISLEQLIIHIKFSEFDSEFFTNKSGIKLDYEKSLFENLIFLNIDINDLKSIRFLPQISKLCESLDLSTDVYISALKNDLREIKFCSKQFIKKIEDEIINIDYIIDSYQINLNNFIGWILSGKLFNILFRKMKFVKLTNITEIHNGFHFKDGLNVDNKKFNPHEECSAGGIYFTEKIKMRIWFHYSHSVMVYCRNVSIPNDAKVYIETDKLKADKIILSKRHVIK